MGCSQISEVAGLADGGMCAQKGVVRMAATSEIWRMGVSLLDQQMLNERRLVWLVRLDELEVLRRRAELAQDDACIDQSALGSTPLNRGDLIRRGFTWHSSGYHTKSEAAT